MSPERIEKLRDEYTDKYVVVDEARPELARFSGFVGQVKTINMNGRALVEFDWYNNIGWFDIELDYLKVVDKREPQKPAAKAPAKKPAKPAAAKDEQLSSLEKARMEGEGKPAGGKMSTADILAAARGQKPAAGEKPAVEKPAAPKQRSKMSTADILAAARGGTKPAKPEEPTRPPSEESQPPSTAEILEASRRPKGGAKAEAKPAAEKPAAAKPGKADRSKMSVADMLAAARAEKSGGGAAQAPAEEAPAESPPASEPSAPESTEPESTAPEPAEAEAPPPPPADKGDLPKTTEEILAYCRRVDGS